MAQDNVNGISNEVEARFCKEAKTLLVLCPFCKHVSHMKVGDSVKAKDYLGNFHCYGGYRSPDNVWEDCNAELIVKRIL